MGGKLNVRAALVLAVALGAGSARAIETGDITLKEGYVDPSSGVRVAKVVTDPASGLQTITLEVPRKYGEIDEIVVKGRRPAREPLKQRKRYEKVPNPSEDYYGYVVYLGKRNDVPVRLFMDARQDYQGRMTTQP